MYQITAAEAEAEHRRISYSSIRSPMSASALPCGAKRASAQAVIFRSAVTAGYAALRRLRSTYLVVCAYCALHQLRQRCVENVASLGHLAQPGAVPHMTLGSPLTQ